MKDEYYIRDGDTLDTLYLVDREANLIKMVGSKIGSFSLSWPLRDYLPEGFVRVEVVEEDGSVVRVRRGGESGYRCSAGVRLPHSPMTVP